MDDDDDGNHSNGHDDAIAANEEMVEVIPEARRSSRDERKQPEWMSDFHVGNIADVTDVEIEQALSAAIEVPSVGEAKMYRHRGFFSGRSEDVPPSRLLQWENRRRTAIEDSSVGEPKTYREALDGQNGPNWQIAMDAEYKSLCDNQVSR